MTLLSLESVAVSISGRRLVGPISLDLEDGQSLCLVGESGSGKSLLLAAIAGLAPPGAQVTGAIRFDGKETLQLDERAMARMRGEKIGFVFQEPMAALNPLQTIGAQVGETIAENREAAVAEALRLAELHEDLSSRFPHQLSGGQRQRALIAMAIIRKPLLLLADEPTTALDAVTQSEIIRVLRDLARARRMATILVTHDLGLAATVSERIAVMRDGRIVETLDAREGFSAVKDPYSQALLAAAQFRPAPPPPPRPDRVLSVTTDADHAERSPLGRIRRRNPALRNVTIDVSAGETVGIVGPSGCGKSTLARVILRLHPKGDATLAEHVPTAPVQIVFQDPASSLDPRMRIDDIVAEPLWSRKDLDRTERRRRAEELIRRVGLPLDAAARRPHALSGGQKQRVAIARALIAEPRLVILDEALSALDVTVQRQILELLATLQAEHGLAYLLITHDIQVLRGFAHRIMVMENGTIVEQGATESVLSAPTQTMTRALIDAAQTVRGAL
jgi:peptide/nickel transport system ATP-binding protein